MEKSTAGASLLFTVEIVNSVHQLGTGALLIVKNYILGLTLGIDFIYLFDSQSKDENSNISSSGTVVLLKFDTLHSLHKISLLQWLPTDSLTALSMPGVPLHVIEKESKVSKAADRLKKSKKRKYYDELKLFTKYLRQTCFHVK